MVKSADGKRHGSKFRMNRYDSAQKDGGGERAAAHEETAVPSGEREEQLEEQVAPGIHDEIKQIAAEHGPAHEVHIQHDHMGGRHHVHSMHPDGYEHHADHMTAEDAHEHAKHAAGVAGEEDNEANEGTDEFDQEPSEEE